MRRELIQFAFDNQAHFIEFDVDVIRRGGVLHLEIDNSPPRIHARALPTTRPYKIVSVTKIQPEGYRLVSLLRAPLLPLDLPKQIVRVTQGQVDQVVAEAKLANVAAGIPFDDLANPKVIEKSPIGRIQAVIDRLDLVSTLGQQDVGKALWLQYRGLVAYLLLTCFDLLGQNDEWIEFGAWLRSSRHETERKTNLPPENIDPIRGAELLLAKHTQAYGVRRAFQRFVDKVLPSDVRVQLMQSIEIARSVCAPLPGENEPPVLLDDNKKAEWLFQIRNEYTHRGLYVPGGHDVILPTDMRGDDEWWYMGDVYKETHVIRYSVRRWPKILDVSVRAGLAAYVHGLQLTELSS